MSKLKFVSWNCHFNPCEAEATRGLTPEKMDAILEYKPDVLVIQESTRWQHDAIRYYKKYGWLSSNWYGDDFDKKVSSLGLSVFSRTWKIEFTDAFNRNFRYVVPYHITQGKTTFTLFAVWTKLADDPNNYQKTVWEALDWYRDIITGDRVVIGDFNTFANAKSGKDEYKKLCENLRRTGFSDVITKSGEPAETYHDKGGNFGANDFCFVSDGITGTPVKVERDKTWDKTQKCCWLGGLSDHCPIIVDFDFP